MSNHSAPYRFTYLRNKPGICPTLQIAAFLFLLFSASGASAFGQIPLFVPPGTAVLSEPAPLQLTPAGKTGEFRSEPAGSRPLLLPAPQLLPPANNEHVAKVLQDGQQLESESRWGEVLTHYEAALRTYRNDTALMDRYRVARFHYDVGRRFHDSSYLKLISNLSVAETLNFFGEVAARIQQDYADTPNWDQLFRHGLQDFSIALSDAAFRKNAGLFAAAEKIDAYLNAVKTTANGWEIRHQEDMKNGLLHIAEMGQKQIGLNPVIVLMEFTCGVINSLDPYTAYLTPHQLNDQYAMISGNLVGLGVELRTDRDSLLIVRVIPGSPAMESGLKDGDRILTVDGISTRGRDTDNAADLLQGKEGTRVRLSVVSAGMGQRPRNIEITRRQIDVPSVEDVRMISDKLGYVKLTSFQSKTCAELRRALAELERKGMKGFILDLRRNPGGLFQVGVEVADMFIDKGAIVRTQGRQNKVKNSLDSPYMATAEQTYKMPMIVLIDEESASAAEIVAGALRDHDRAVIIGKRSYGKGTIQQILPVRTGTDGVRSGVKLTVEKFYSPKGWAYSGVGVSPHIAVKDENRIALARPLEGRLILPLPRTVSSNLDDPFIQEAVKAAAALPL
ncbi:MAG: S41 family peptidase [Planctomycetaceae bacterium]|jgi:carboxyl-terminal processing protease|nr:S41 family peptidase [Planctomycetaceae bacterium]